jgi:hypothetical protein
MFGSLGTLNEFLPYKIFNLSWAYWDKTPLKIKEHLYHFLHVKKPKEINVMQNVMKKIKPAVEQTIGGANLAVQTTQS